ncbi:MAG: SDR family NAD(P)-dependent oxidoreductase [Actinomycetota bacterium]|nr:SDR family NAD(P)-dependent oxidoreductase [Actinomycetota bacterium]
MKLRGSRVLLTGATGGLGHAIARTLADSGADLVLTGRRADVLEALAADVGGEVVAADLGTRDGLDRLVAAAGRVDIVVANAALPASGPLLDFDLDDIDRCLEVNLRAPIALARIFAPAMVARGEGHLSFVSSLSGMAATAGTSIYSATKFGLRGFAHALRQDLHGTGVGASVVLPGFIRGAGMFADSGAALPAGVRTSTPEQVATAVRRSIVKNRAELVVAPRELHAGALVGAVAPSVAARAARRLGSNQLAADIAAGQQHQL